MSEQAVSYFAGVFLVCLLGAVVVKAFDLGVVAAMAVGLFVGACYILAWREVER